MTAKVIAITGNVKWREQADLQVTKEQPSATLPSRNTELVLLCTGLAHFSCNSDLTTVFGHRRRGSPPFTGLFLQCRRLCHERA